MLKPKAVIARPCPRHPAAAIAASAYDVDACLKTLLIRLGQLYSVQRNNLMTAPDPGGQHPYPCGVASEERRHISAAHAPWLALGGRGRRHVVTRPGPRLAEALLLHIRMLREAAGTRQCRARLSTGDWMAGCLRSAGRLGQRRIRWPGSTARSHAVEQAAVLGPLRLWPRAARQCAVQTDEKPLSRPPSGVESS